MTEIVLLFVVLAQMGFIYFSQKQFKEERSKMLNAIVAKTPEEFTNFEVIDKLKPEHPVEPVNPDMSPVESLSDDDFDKFVVKGGANG
jgi:hypothetical protein